MTMADGGQEHVIDGAQEQLVEGFVCGIILFVEEGISLVGLVDGENLGCCLVWRDDVVQARVPRCNEVDVGQCVEHDGGNTQCQQPNAPIAEVRLDGGRIVIKFEMYSSGLVHGFADDRLDGRIWETVQDFICGRHLGVVTQLGSLINLLTCQKLIELINIDVV